MFVVWTIGYEGHRIDQFSKVLREYGIERVVDVRRIPLGDEKRFAKDLLSRYLAVQGIAYDLRRELAGPKDGLEAPGGKGGLEASIEEYRKVVPRKALDMLAHTATGQRTAVLSRERDPWAGVRGPIGKELEARGFKVAHIM